MRRKKSPIYWINSALAGSLFIGLVGASIKYLPNYFTRLRYETQLNKGIWEGVVTDFKPIVNENKSPISESQKLINLENGLLVQKFVQDKDGKVSCYSENNATDFYFYAVNTLGYRVFRIPITETNAAKLKRLDDLLIGTGFNNEIWRENDNPAKGCGPIKVRLPGSFKEYFITVYTPIGSTTSKHKATYCEVSIDDILEINGVKLK